ncbi:MAG: HD domain-containing protein, partial [Eubacterium sp.]
RLTGIILKDCGFSSPEITEIQGAIRHHRDADAANTPLSNYLYRADKASRCCFACPAIKDCHWPDSKKNLTLTL